MSLGLYFPTFRKFLMPLLGNKSSTPGQPNVLEDFNIPKSLGGVCVRLGLYVNCRPNKEYEFSRIFLFLDLFVCLFWAWQPSSGPRIPRSRGFLITHNDAPQSVELLWTSDQLDAETSTWQHTTLTTDWHPCPPSGFEPPISVAERPPSYALDRAATGTGFPDYSVLVIVTNISLRFDHGITPFRGLILTHDSVSDQHSVDALRLSESWRFFAICSKLTYPYLLMWNFSSGFITNKAPSYCVF
jgi:hypothetical protein